MTCRLPRGNWTSDLQGNSHRLLRLFGRASESEHRQLDPHLVLGALQLALKQPCGRMSPLKSRAKLVETCIVLPQKRAIWITGKTVWEKIPEGLSRLSDY